MKKVTKNEVDFSEIFDYAKEKYQVGWNRANDMFFNNSLEYKSFNEYSLGEPLEMIDESKTFDLLEEHEKGYFIINQFMIDNKIRNIFIDNR